MGLGKTLDYKAITPAILKDTVFSVLSDQKILDNVQAMKETVAIAPGNVGAVKIIEQYKKDWQTASFPTIVLSDDL